MLAFSATLTSEIVSPASVIAQTQPPQQSANSSTKQLKHKLAVGRFSNETRYGQSLLRDNDLDPLGKQAADILMAYLAQTGKFLLFERPDIAKIEREQAREGSGNTVGADTLIIGSIVEFGRTEDGKRGFLNKERTQRAQAKVAVRLVDVRTGLVFHSATGSGEATTETKTVLGIGSTSSFNGTLTDKALSVAVEDMLDELVNTLADRPWRSDILAMEGSQIFISGGKSQGVQVGDRFRVLKPGRVVRSAQTGFDIALPPTEVAQIQVQSLFGDNETNQGAIASAVQGSLAGMNISDLMVAPL
jgi:curli biogenesis system outer membrane secretion channel CsgG